MIKLKIVKAEDFMAYEETEENILLALTELDTVRNILNRECKSTDKIFDKFNRACSYLKCAGNIDDVPKPITEYNGYYDSSNSILKQYFISSDDNTCYNHIFNMVNFLLNHQGTSAQFAIALSLLFANDKNIRCYPAKVRLKLKKDEKTAESFSFINFVQIIDDDGTLVHSYYIDIFNDIPATIVYTRLLDKLKDLHTNENQECTYAGIEGINFFSSSIDVLKNFTIIECLTDGGGVSFNSDGYDFDITNGLVENCANIENYVSKRELKEHLSNYL